MAAAEGVADAEGSRSVVVALMEERAARERRGAWSSRDVDRLSLWVALRARFAPSALEEVGREVIVGAGGTGNARRGAGAAADGPDGWAWSWKHALCVQQHSSSSSSSV